MAEQPAARVSDKIMCPLQTPTPGGPVPHAVPPGNPILPPGCPTVLIGNQPAARIGDQCMCVSPAGPVVPNPIIRGAFPCLIGGQPAARMTDQGAHPGSSISPPCCTTVLIGQGGISGNPWAGQEACRRAADGRTSHSSQQSYENCGVESSRQIINQTPGNKVGEDDLLDQAMDHGWAERAATRDDSGGQWSHESQAMLAAYGIGSSLQPQTMGNIEGSVAQGRGVITAHEAGRLWGTTQQGGHAVLVTGVQYDANGNPTNVIVNDTGTGQCMNYVPAGRFRNSLRGDPILVTRNPIW